MKLSQLQKVGPDAEKTTKVFNTLILGTHKGQEFLAGKIIKIAKWLFVMPVEYLEQLISSLEVRKGIDPQDEESRIQILAMLKALVPVKKLLDENWKDLEI